MSDSGLEPCFTIKIRVNIMSVRHSGMLSGQSVCRGQSESQRGNLIRAEGVVQVWSQPW